MRAPLLARIPAVAAPRPDAEPVMITHMPSFDIGFLLLFLSRSSFARAYHTTARNAKLRSAELIGLMPAPQARIPDIRLVRGVAFPHHRAQEQMQASRIAGHPKQEERRVVEREHCRRDRGENLRRSRRRADH